MQIAQVSKLDLLIMKELFEFDRTDAINLMAFTNCESQCWPHNVDRDMTQVMSKDDVNCQDRLCITKTSVKCFVSFAF